MFKFFIEKIIEDCSDDDNACEYSELFKAWAEYSLEDIGCNEKLESEKEINPEAISYSIMT